MTNNKPELTLNSDSLLFPPNSTVRQNIIWVFATAIIYFIVARLSLLLIFKPEGIAAIWPPSGIFLSAILLTRRTLRPYLIGVLLITDLIAEILAGSSLPMSLIYSFALTCDAMLSAWLLHRFIGQTIVFDRVKHVLAFIILSVFLSNAITSLIAAAAPTVLLGKSFWVSWQWWFFGDGSGNLIVTPCIMSLVFWRNIKKMDWGVKRIVEGAALVILILLIALFGFGIYLNQLQSLTIIRYMTFPLFIWAALRYGIPGVSISSLLFTSLALVLIVSRHNLPSLPVPMLELVIMVQVSLAFLIIPTLILGAIVSERKRTEEKLMSTEKRLRELNELQGLLLLPSTIGEKLKLVTEAVVRIVGADFARIWMIQPGDRCEAGCIHAQITEGPHVCRFRNRCLHMIVSSGRYIHTNGQDHGRVPFGCYKIGRIASSEESNFLTNNVTNDPRVHNHTWAKELGLRSFAGYRLTDTDGAPLGVLALFSKQAISPEENLLLQGIAQSTSQVMQAARTEEALRESETKYRYLIEQMQDGVYRSSHEGKFLEVNPAMVKILGYESKEELMAIDIKSQLYFAAADRESAALDEKLEEMAIFRLRKKDDSEVWVEDHGRHVVDEQGNVRYHEGVLRDVSERTLAEEKRKSLEVQLRESQKLQGIGTLASGIAHDFNNLLGIIIGYTSLLEHLPGNPAEVKKNADAITKASRRGAELVKQLLTFARKTDIHVEAIRLNDVVVEASKLLNETFPKTISLSLNLGHKLPAITADANQIHQVIVNLCVNARDAMPEGGTLSISTFLQEGELIRTKFAKVESKEYVGLRVADTGTGMSEETRQRIFEPFFTTKGIGKGTGLGLSVVFGIIESHNGFIDVQSEPGKGTTFHVYFPVPFDFAPVEEAHQQTSEKISGGSETILIIEDEEMLRDMIRELLESNGYAVLTAADGEQGVKQYHDHQKEINLVLSDLGLPVLTGFEAFKRMKTIDPAVKFILATGYIEPESSSDYLIAGMKNILHKPYSPEELLRSVRTTLDLK